MDRGTVAKKSRKRRKNSADNTPHQEKELVYFSNDTILEAVKFLNYEKWSKMRFLCRRVNQLIHSNQSKLQAFEVKSLSIGEVISRSSNSIVSFDEAIKPVDAVTKWFQDRGYLCDETTNMPLEKVFVGMNLSGWNGLHVTIRAFYEEYRERNMPLTRAEAKRTGKLPKIDRCLSNSATLRSKPPVVFSAKLDAKYEFYGPILSHFFRLLYHPTAYFREVSTFPLMTDKFCDITSHSPIRCDQFTLLHFNCSYMFMLNSLKWLKDNVRAQNIRLSLICMDEISYLDLHSLLLEFILLLDASVCARDHIKLFWLPHPGEFVKALIKKYEILEVTKAIPSILIENCPSEIQPGYYQYLESILVRQDDPIIADKFCDMCNVKSYELQNKLDGNRKMIVQVGPCPEPRCDGYIDPIVYMKFE